MSRSLASICRLGLLTIVVALLGCGGDDIPLGYVEGTVTLDGKPVEGAIVTFVPTENEGTTASGRTDADGHYLLMFTFRREGAMLGTNDVLIDYNAYDESLPPNKQRPNLFPAQYGRPGALTADVQSGRQTIDFELESTN
ncbi:carboxypeptidase-like regulatory domain-containing protein [Blastopirellula marina]|uniref:Carboxypeptidase regulatory-like domain-containing protein n=1 Tax=Blastopirellula marina DSM 3645 TaxID=314230 RepID=A3ZM35_9BACT|nr:carboxypeptidase-like regulatory domain-containing protein [Blastopirellula marina]EAQ82818.1 hypothetical protein DSM3645_10472 [Blastopirellula marina DSM 3645]